MVMKDISDQRFGRLIAIQPMGVQNKATQWLCKCDCGNQKIVAGTHLRKGHTQSCGCIAKEHASRLHKFVQPKQRRNDERIYHIWKGMRRRCKGYDEHHNKYYYSRGISICDEWNDYLKFKEWALSNGYSDDLTIDRIDNNKGYSPDNCRWISMFDQASNKRNNRWITINGATKTLTQWSRIINQHSSVVHGGLKRNGVNYILKRLPKEYII